MNCPICDFEAPVEEMFAHIQEHPPVEMQAFIALHMPTVSAYIDEIAASETIAPGIQVPELLRAMAHDLESADDGRDSGPEQPVRGGADLDGGDVPQEEG